MKKAIVLLLVLAVLGGAVFAQPTISGYVRTIATYSEDGLALSGERLRLNLAWTSEDEMVSFGARFENTFSTSPSPKYAYGMFKFLDGKAAVSGGYLWNWDYDLSSGMSDYGPGNVANGGGWNTFANKKGMIAQVMPIDALSIGLLVLPAGTAIGPENFGVAASYAIEGVGDVIVHAALANDVSKSNASASFKYTGMEGLGVAVGYKGVKGFDKIAIYSIVDYETGDFTGQLAGEYNVDAKSIYVEAGLKYVMGDFSALGFFAFDKDAGNLNTGEDDASYALNTETGAIDMTPATALVESQFIVGAELAYNVGNGSIAIVPTYDDGVGFTLPIVVKVKF